MRWRKLVLSGGAAIGAARGRRDRGHDKRVLLRTVALFAIAALTKPCGVIQICMSRTSTAERKSRSGAACSRHRPRGPIWC